MPKVMKLMPSEFSDLVPKLIDRLTKDLQREQQDCALPALGKDPLWDTPEVDSKTVAKLSPAVKELTGGSLDPRWVRRGGYDSIAEAVAHIVRQIEQHRVAVPATSPSAPAPADAIAVH